MSSPTLSEALQAIKGADPGEFSLEIDILKGENEEHLRAIAQNDRLIEELIRISQTKQEANAQGTMPPFRPLESPAEQRQLVEAVHIRDANRKKESSHLYRRIVELLKDGPRSPNGIAVSLGAYPTSVGYQLRKGLGKDFHKEGELWSLRPCDERGLD